MTRLLLASAPDFSTHYRALLQTRGEAVDGVEAVVSQIIQDVKARGFHALADLSARFDNFALTPETVRIGPAAVNAAMAACDRQVIAALELAAERILDYHLRARPEDARWQDGQGLSLGWRWTPVDAAGLYAPGGLAAYPSSVLMNALPAKAAGVQRLVMMTPPARLHENPAILAAAKIAGIDEIYGVGGAQAIAALAYGADPIAPVDVIAGPGNAWVSTAKKLVFGTVGIDSVAGPSEVFIIADGRNDPAIIAADLLAQAEHDAVAQSILFTDDAAFGQRVLEAVDLMIAQGGAGPEAAKSWPAYGAVIVVDQLVDAVALSDQGAPEHLQIATDDPDHLASLVRHAGAIFLGRHSPEALGDYLAGPNHVLPTGGRSRWASGLSTHMFMKRTTLMGTGLDGLAAIGPAGVALATAEGLPAHAASIALRLKAAGLDPA
ncbi:histidinol dehydrogenase [Candidatus Phycosocius bacilliformis]|uniref:Histidinol dehydrogenase n=1 Tax=Candidatus Phycosocius bacilliformis TaxID=1445552 RepID=A0A2P2EB45_9PROT|nr:histidinol dehydrogenase [Candidatus Phycosocius bacilliformis]GBF58296.1 histidinol dehydrogenase [Candidatus Phycosocius bacilliformis]